MLGAGRISIATAAPKDLDGKYGAPENPSHVTMDFAAITRR